MVCLSCIGLSIDLSVLLLIVVVLVVLVVVAFAVGELTFCFFMLFFF